MNQIANQTCVRDVQYRDSTKLAARANLHVKYGRSEVPWFHWIAIKADLPERAAVLDIGCGAGWLWEKAAAHFPETIAITSRTSRPAWSRKRSAAFAGSAGGAQSRGARPTCRLCLFPMPISMPCLPATCSITCLIRPKASRRSGACSARAAGRSSRRTGLPACASFMLLVRRCSATPASIPAPWPSVSRRQNRYCADSSPRWSSSAIPAASAARIRRTVYAYFTSFPPGDGASAEELAHLRRVVEEAFAEAGGALDITRDTGLLRCRKAG